MRMKRSGLARRRPRADEATLVRFCSGICWVWFDHESCNSFEFCFILRVVLNVTLFSVLNHCRLNFIGFWTVAQTKQDI